MAHPSPIPSELIVRQHERYSCSMPARLRVIPDDAVQITLSRSAGDGSGWVACTLVDCSSGGLGVQLPVFFPRGARVQIQVLNPAPAQGASPELFKGVARVQRVSMVDRTPTYYAGCLLVSGGSGMAQIRALLDFIRSSGAKRAE
ncbi:MAG TPA: PilZ domain-containing protein [Phycisphaerales bacterium]|jgi:hypothetical protein|nr:PilZ domain-containing protein [Phycisphaerales bacterium]